MEKKIPLFISAAGLKGKVQITFSHWWFSVSFSASIYVKGMMEAAGV